MRAGSASKGSASERTRRPAKAAAAISGRIAAWVPPRTARAILQDHRQLKGRVWERFTGNGEKTAEMILGFYEALAEAFAKRLPGQLSDELQLTVGQLVAESGLTPDRGWVRPG